MNKRINTLYFSATDTTRKIVTSIAEELAKHREKGKTIRNMDFTLPEGRKAAVSYEEDDVVIIGIPVYAGRVPNVLLKYLNSIQGNGALAVAIVVYGNRNYDDALIELKDILELDGFKVIAAAAFIGEHAFSKILAQNRPDEKDSLFSREFAKQIDKKMTTQVEIQPIVVNGNKPYRNYYMPRDRQGNPVDIRRVTPKTNSNCTDCKHCVNICPMGSIDSEDPSKLIGICIKCGACVKKCPVNAKYYEDQDYLRHKSELEIEFARRREPELFI
ncbi:EFR1 family ferrodoxin [Desulfitobacterium metallireducens]|uniref:Ferredoxin n=1 Tax=Desulfitobacterium metallireducens DSM 15288 TaxID=871968 RepID=W0E6V0_9FIRM|nr:EFR1 family ferrodoxin [Desulfitobacterium metallireducens]AHF06497.1 ferredoxin [Desulfitobacterium metallireducens DSM 15288]